MESEQSIDTKEVCERLRSGVMLSYHFDSFCRNVADNLKATTTPINFLIACELVIHDTQSNNGFQIGKLIRLAMPTIVKKVFPEDFANLILKENDELCNWLRARL